MVTPYLKTMNENGGSLYVFPSASKDLTRTMVSNDYEFKFSHFACLNLPNIDLSEESDEKRIHLGVFDYSNNETTISDQLNKGIVEHLQNYVMNFETAILNGEGDNDDYDNDILTSVSEKVFFNWLQKVGGITFNDNIESYTTSSDGTTDRTIPYIGNIDMMNTAEINGDTYEELYLLISSKDGASTKVYFRDGSATDNKNYLDKEYPTGGDNESYIIGRTSDDGLSPYGLSISPIVDDEDGNVYIGDSGHTIDFRDSSYADGDGISEMNANSTTNFEFNAVLIYYDLLEKTSESGVKKLATNLYGILFLEEIGISDNSNNYGWIQRYPKIKETETNNKGNSFAIKIDLKIDTIPDTNCTVESYISSNSAVSMALYERALTQLENCIDLFYEQKTVISNLQSRINTLESLLSGIDSMDTIRGEIDRLYDLYDNSSTVDNDTILGLIEVNSNKLDTIMNGGKDIKLQYDTDVLQAGTGVTLDKSLNKVVISASQGYAIDTVYSDENYAYEVNDENPIDPSSSSANCYIKLKSGMNIAVLPIDDCGTYNSTINIYINDDIGWKVGQSMKIHMKPTEDDETLNLEDSYGINIYNGDQAVYQLYGGDTLKDITTIEVVCTADDEFIYLLNK